MAEQFKDAGPCPIKQVEIQPPSTDAGQHKHVGQLWLGFDWLTVAQARELRDWLTEILP